NYAFTLPMLGADVQFFVEPKIVNVLDRSGVLTPNAAVFTARNSGQGLAKFNPFTTKPIECPQNDTAAQCTALGANWKLAPTFGKPQGATDYQQPRTFYISFGVRF
ncbi:MAG TPA: hypothetical protein VLW17_14200, partial [Thermoanaerobaculaceae bacterium]|nr:hypothetical protein [Thermoanaerobaculaceae bacterium]